MTRELRLQGTVRRTVLDISLVISRPGLGGPALFEREAVGIWDGS